MSHHIHLQYIEDKTLIPKKSLLRLWAKTALNQKIVSAEITIRVVGIKEMSDLNITYRHKKGPTNVLSFPSPSSIPTNVPFLGDIVICAQVIHHEARNQGKSIESHFAHMIIHGVFHLLGYNHETKEEAKIMESLEIDVMKILGFENPYEPRKIT